MYPEFKDIVPPKVVAYILLGLAVISFGLWFNLLEISWRVLSFGFYISAGIVAGYWLHEFLHYIVAYVLDLQPKVSRWTLYVIPSAVSYSSRVRRRQFYAVVLAPFTGSLLGLLLTAFLFSNVPLSGGFVFMVSTLATCMLGADKDIAWFIGVYQRGWECIEEHPSGTAIRPCGTTEWWSARLPGPFERTIRLPGQRVGDNP